VGQDSSVSIATFYRLDGPGIKSRWRGDFPHPSRPPLWATQSPIQWVPSLSGGVKQPGRDVDHPPPSSAEVTERVELYLYSTSGLLWPVTGWTLPSFYLCIYHVLLSLGLSVCLLGISLKIAWKILYTTKHTVCKYTSNMQICVCNSVPFWQFLHRCLMCRTYFCSHRDCMMWVSYVPVWATSLNWCGEMSVRLKILPYGSSHSSS
jgi:hypothetical protein